MVKRGVSRFGMLLIAIVVIVILGYGYFQVGGDLAPKASLKEVDTCSDLFTPDDCDDLLGDGTEKSNCCEVDYYLNQIACDLYGGGSEDYFPFMPECNGGKRVVKEFFVTL
jgi:hypothetical protein